MRFALLCVLLSPMFCWAGDKENTAALGQILRDVQAVLPETWEAVLNPDRQTDHLQLIVRTRQPVATVTVALGISENYKPPPPDMEVYELKYTLYPLLTREQFIEAKGENDVREAQRLAYAEEHLIGIAWGHKGPRPIPPSRYHPKTDAQREKVRQYAVLWMRTELTDLPTHYRGQLAFQHYHPWMTVLVEEPRQKELASIQTAMEKLSTRYEPLEKD